MNDSQLRERLLAERQTVLQKISELEASLAVQKALLSSLDNILGEKENPPSFPQTLQTETPPSPPPKRRSPSRASSLTSPRMREPYRGLSVDKAVLKAIYQIKKREFTISDLFYTIYEPIYEPEEKAQAQRARRNMTTAVSNHYRRGGVIERVGRGTYRRIEETSSSEEDLEA